MQNRRSFIGSLLALIPAAKILPQIRLIDPPPDPVEDFPQALTAGADVQSPGTAWAIYDHGWDQLGIPYSVMIAAGVMSPAEAMRRDGLDFEEMIRAAGSPQP